MNATVAAMLPTPCRTRHPVDVGERSEAIVIAAFVRNGYSVLVPFGSNHRYDLALEDGSRLIRVQCKTGRLRSGAIRFNSGSIRTNAGGTIRRAYAGEIDLFAVYCRDTEGVYVVPLADAATTLGSLRIDPPANGQRSGIRWASDYELPA